MAQVSGIGGIFFRSRNPDALMEWYRTYLGVPSIEPWPQPAGPAVFAPFKDDTDYWPEGKQWMINLKVADLAALMGDLRAAGIDVTQQDDWIGTPYGDFARIYDPEGTPIELWQPPAEG
ncbi:glyoxalase [Actibacterium mucosum KCTC 23349]|uniref:Glyoxalase n=1 Tax=Actibacterium mucosum KCTC 23349 TaxID=1454373 RepID=A0A037ZK76_9RHOB|nr:glyoxalase/bleomycin resistance/dioxygenase family protein [Actibacterium mucosum]KAJ56503.1 glyoxalase [Actibacterium mucosum KCTC 23349]